MNHIRADINWLVDGQKIHLQLFVSWLFVFFIFKKENLPKNCFQPPMCGYLLVFLHYYDIELNIFEVLSIGCQQTILTHLWLRNIFF